MPLHALKFLLGKQVPIPNTGSLARDLLASERTYLAWTRSALGLVALGIGLDRFEALREDITSVAAGGQPASVKASAASGKEEQEGILEILGNMSPSKSTGLLLVGCGAVTMVQASYRYYAVMQQIRVGTFAPNVRGVFLIGASCLGVFAAVIHAEVTHHTKYVSAATAHPDLPPDYISYLECAEDRIVIKKSDIPREMWDL